MAISPLNSSLLQFPTAGISRYVRGNSQMLWPLLAIREISPIREIFAI